MRCWLSFKTHPVPQLAREWLRSGRGVEVVSESEFIAVRNCGFPVEQLLVNGVAKHAWLPRHSAPGLRVHFDSLQEIDVLLRAAATDEWNVGLRCHVPCERDARDARFGGQFGLSPEEVAVASSRLAAGGVHVDGVHFHLGHGARHTGAFEKSVRYVVELCTQHGLTPRYIDCGGGLGSAPDVDEAINELATSFNWARNELPSLTELWTENGRWLTRASAALIVSVLDVKLRDECRYLICDGGRTNHALDADNGPHALILLPERPGRLVLTTITGPTCMTDDCLGRVMLPDTIVPGDRIIWLDAGAYHLPWETRFSAGLCAVVWADASETLTLARQREVPEDWSRQWAPTTRPNK